MKKGTSRLKFPSVFTMVLGPLLASQMKADYAAFFFGTLAPFLRASDNPMAIACLRLFTFPPLPPLPDFSVPRFLRRMALATDLLAPLLYLRPLDFFFLGIRPPDNLDFRLLREVVRSGARMLLLGLRVASVRDFKAIRPN